LQGSGQKQKLGRFEEVIEKFAQINDQEKQKLKKLQSRKDLSPKS